MAAQLAMVRMQKTICRHGGINKKRNPYFDTYKQKLDELLSKDLSAQLELEEAIRAIEQTMLEGSA